MQNLTISQAAKILKVHPNTLRNWEQKKILIPFRGKNNYRYYTQSQISTFLMRGATAKVQIKWGYNAGIKERINELKTAQKSINACVSSTVTTPFTPKLDTTLHSLAQRAMLRGVKIRFIRNLNDPIMKQQALRHAMAGIKTKNREIAGITFSIIDQEIVRLEVPTDNPDYRLYLKIFDKEVAKSFGIFFELLWKKTSNLLHTARKIPLIHESLKN